MSVSRGSGAQGRQGPENPLHGAGHARASRIVEALATAGGVTLVTGFEFGRGGDPSPSPPSPEPPCTALDRGEREAFTARAAALRGRVTARVRLPAERVALLLSAARVVEVAGAAPETSHPAFARVVLGCDPRLPDWARSFPLDASAEQDDAEWLEPLAREVSGWSLPAGGAPPQGAFVLDAFAAADLLRAAALGWLDPALPDGARVLPAGFDVLERDPSARCIVRDGRLVGRAASWAASWRSLPEPAWRALAVETDAAAPFPAALPVVTRLVLAGGAAVAFGYDPAAGRRIGPWALAPDGLREALGPACGPAVLDGTGFPLAAPPFVVERAP